MYKLFLTFRYLTRKKIVLFPILVVWLCVMMLIIVSSIMGGFVERVRQTNHDLFGDIVISNGGSSLGWSRYEDLQNQLKAKFPEIETSTPVINAFALIWVKNANQTLPAQLVGVDPVGRAKVSKFRESLFLQYQAPMQAVEDLRTFLPATKKELVDAAAKNEEKADAEAFAAGMAMERSLAEPGPNYFWLTGLVPVLLVVAWLMRPRRQRDAWSFIKAGFVVLTGTLIILLGVYWPLIFPNTFSLAEDRADQAGDARTRAARTAQYAMSLPEGRFANSDELIKQLVPAEPSFKLAADAPVGLPPDGAILGSRIGFFMRDARGNFVHHLKYPHEPVTITVFPVSQSSGAVDVKMRSNSMEFTNIDDSYTGVYDVDLKNVYASFDLVQQLAGLKPDPEIVKENPDNPAVNFAPMCHQVLIKLKPGLTAEQTRQVRARIANFVHAYQEDHPEMYRRRGDLDPILLSVRTWDEEQKQYLDAVKNEKTMMTFILGLMSMVVLVVIFLIFYQIVRDKTRNIGIIKAVGGSEEGVAGIFLTYGLFVGIVGGAMGVIGGVAFVIHTNEIHEWIYRTTGVVIWDRSVYLFDRIPDQVNPWEVVIFFSIALAAGIFGALIPAIVAGAEDPVKAVRYE